MSKKTKADFENSIKEIDNIIEKMENGELTLEESIENYETAMKLLFSCSKILDESEGKIKKIREENGNISFEDFS